VGTGERLTARVASALRPTSIIATDREAGSNCPYCRFTFKRGTALLRCPACSAAHHDDCWTDNGGCAVVGCSAAPSAAAGGAAPGRPPPTAVSPPGPPPLPMPPPAARPASSPARPAARRRGWSALDSNALAIGLIVLAVVVGVVAASIALLGRSGDDTAADRAAGTSQAGSDESGGGDDAPAPRPVAEDRQEIIMVLRRYAAAYTNHDTDSLRFVFTPDVTRHGLAPGGCRDSSGRAAVLLQYRRQFDLGTGTYTLRGLVPSAIIVDGMSANTDLHFSIGGSRSGRISFNLIRFAGVWRISHVDSHC